jgi:hypothetical protein
MKVLLGPQLNINASVFSQAMPSEPLWESPPHESPAVPTHPAH